MKKVIARMKGGLGNQLFCYAAARRLAYVNHSELVLDDTSGFSRDYLYGRNYQLGHFKIFARKATDSEKLEPFSRYRRVIQRKVAKLFSFKQRTYIEQEGIDFDNRLLDIKLKKTVYLDGLWQSEQYFKDIEAIIRKDLEIISPVDNDNMKVADEIRNSNSVALHIRWFDSPGDSESHNIAGEYYQHAISLINEKVKNPHFFVFSDNPESVFEKIPVDRMNFTIVSHNKGDENAYADLWLMTQCKHIITANSTFSWWAAWLNSNPEKIIITPGIILTGKTAWNFTGLIPEAWIKI